MNGGTGYLRLHFRRRLLRGTSLVGIAAVLLIWLLSFLGNREFREVFYQISSAKTEQPIRVIQISDLHQTEYGKDNRDLLERIEILSPDILVMTGDIMDKDSAGYADVVAFCQTLTSIAPVVYIYGNNETEIVYQLPMTKDSLHQFFGCDDETSGDVDVRLPQDTLRSELEAAGVTVLLNEQIHIPVGETVVDIYGTLTSNPSAFWPYSGKSFADYAYGNPEHFKLMLVHEPYLMEALSEAWGDLVLCGHTHGGLIRLPRLGGVYEPQHGFFPELRSEAYIYGQYETNGIPLIVSGGLENKNICRIGNPPELLIIDIQ